jgi:nicotinamidase-related amidase
VNSQSQAKDTKQPHMETIMPSLTLFPKSTALVLIDLQKGITSFPVEPHPTEVVLENASLLADQFRGLNAPVFLVRAAFPSGPLALNLVTDAKALLPANEPEGWSEPAVKPQENDVLILKRLVEDAMASFSKTQHDFATQNIFPRLGRVRTTVEIVRALRETD